MTTNGEMEGNKLGCWTNVLRIGYNTKKRPEGLPCTMQYRWAVADRTQCYKTETGSKSPPSLGRFYFSLVPRYQMTRIEITIKIKDEISNGVIGM
jgi:hypothetical protein